MSQDEPARPAAPSKRKRSGRARGRVIPAHRNGDRNRFKDTGGHATHGVGFYLEQTLKTEPDHVDASLREIASVAWASYDSRRDPADVWPEVLSRSERCPECGRVPQPSADGNLVCPACDLVLVGGCR